MLDGLADKYKLREKREGIHLSTLVYCLTRSFFDQQAPVEPTDNEIMLWALGYGLQEVLTPKQATTPIFELEGIVYRPDMVFEVGAYLVELKTTRSGIKRYAEGNYPETWIEYIKGGCYIRSVLSYDLSVLYIAERPIPKFKSETLIFEPEELEANWQDLSSRKDIYSTALASDNPPAPFTTCKEWECKNCRYRLQCEAIAMLVGKEVPV